MYRSLNIETLGITGRQSELIELALTYRFKGLDLDIESFTRHAEKRGQEAASRFLESARNCTGLQVGTWNLPVRWHGSDEEYRAGMKRLPAMASGAAAIGATRCVTHAMAGSDELALKENFEFHTQRLQEIAELLAPHGIHLGVGFHAAAKARADFAHQFVDKAEGLITLVNSIDAANLGFLIDTWNWHLGGGTVDQLAELPQEKVVAVRAADIPADADADSIELNARLLPSPEGQVPIADMLDRLSEKKYEGPVAPFPHASQFKGVTRDKLVQQCADALRAVWPGAEIQEEEAAEAAAAAESEQAGRNGEATTAVAT